MAAPNEHTRSRNLLKVIRDRIKNGVPPIHGYDSAASTIGENKDYVKTVGQSCSLIDAASFVSGWPLLGLHMVRKPNGAMNPESFTDDWGAWNKEIESTAASHQWTVQQVDEVIHALDGLPNEGATALWAGFLKREAQRPGFIRYNLHRKLKTA